jgi:hypothetical protein
MLIEKQASFMGGVVLSFEFKVLNLVIAYYLILDF